jgi:uncharacterized protein (UPF0332 family)
VRSLPYSGLLSDGRVRPHRLTPSQARQRLGVLWRVAERELADSRSETISLDGRYGHAYAAVRALAKAALLAEGYRPTSGAGQHQVVFESLPLVPSAQWEQEGRYFDACRQRRNYAAYRGADVITRTELDQLTQEAEQFSVALRDWLTSQHPALLS